jgi:hypothetical protein
MVKRGNLAFVAAFLGIREVTLWVFTVSSCFRLQKIEAVSFENSLRLLISLTFLSSYSIPWPKELPYSCGEGGSILKLSISMAGKTCR